MSTNGTPAYRSSRAGMKIPAKGTSPARAVRLTLALLPTTLLWVSHCAHAQEAAAPAANADQSDALQEVVVTAQHTREDAQKTPIAMTIFGADELKRNSVTSIQDLSALASDINFTDVQGAPVLTMRGISSLDTNENSDPAVSVNVDGFYLIRPYSLYAGMYDLDRVEVLRGPQGTLNGRNSLGGALNIVTAQPTKQEEFYASLEYGNYNELTTQAMANIPVNDEVQVRMAFMSVSHDGYRRNTAADVTVDEPNGDDADTKSGRVEIAFEPFSSFRGLVTLQYTNEGGAGEISNNVPYVYLPNGALDTNLPPNINSQAFPSDTPPTQSLTERQVRFNLAYDLETIEFTLLGGYDQMQFSHDADSSSAYNPPPSVFTFAANEYPDTYNGEFRIASRGNGRLQWQAGFFAFGQISHLVSADAAPLPDGGWDDFFGFVYNTRASSRAGYAQASYQLTDALKLTAGARYTHDFKSESGYYGDLTGNISYSGPQYGSVSTSKTTYHLALDYDLTSASMVYAKYDTGYKAGGFNLGATTYQPATVTAYEVGSKNRFLNDTLQLNLAAFYDDYANEQVASFVTLPDGEPVALTENAGKSRIYGLEGDLIYKVPVVGTFNVSLDYLNARYTYFLSSADPSNPAETGNVQLAGNTPPQSPTWSARLGLEHVWLINGATLTGRIQSKLQSSSNFSFYNYPDTRQAPYTMSDALLTYAPAEGHWSVTAFVKNLENSVVFTNAEENEYSYSYSYQFYAPRTYGVRLEYRVGH